MQKAKDESNLDSQIRSESYYKNLLCDLKWFFNLRIVFLMISVFLIILFMNQLTSLSASNYEFPISKNTKEHIHHFFFQAYSQASFIAKTINKIVSIQHEHWQEHQELYYMTRSPLTNVKKMIFTQKYGTKGEFTCLNGQCNSIQFYLLNLWAKRNYYNSVQTVYLQYHDPIQNSTNIAYAPTDQNQLSREQIKLMMNNVEEHGQVEKIGDQLYLKVKQVFQQSFNERYEITIVIQIHKAEIERILKSDIELNSFYQYTLSDTAEWINFESGKPLPQFSYQTGETVSEISYVSPCNNNTLLKFYFRIPQIRLFFDFMKVSVLLPVLVLVLQFFRQQQTYRSALDRFFRSMRTLISLYEFNIEEIFTGRIPKQSTILNQTTATQFYQQLSQIPSVEYEPIRQSSKVRVPVKEFAFTDILKAIVEKYSHYARGIFREKNKEIISNKFFIHSSINQISESESLKIKEAFAKAHQLGSVKRLFYFAYLSLLLNPREFDKLIEDDKSALPQQHIKLTREINRVVSSTDVRKAFKLSFDTSRETEEELEMRIQINLLHKYLQILKDLDIHNTYAKELELEEDLENVGEYIENIKHVLNKHNRNIRTFGK